VIRLNEQLLVELGLGALPADERTRLLKHMYETLQMRVGGRLADAMSHAQLEEFDGLHEARDREAALAWLTVNFPNYGQLVEGEFEHLTAEVAAVASDILRTAGVQAPSDRPR
jgi:hypothetical protein